MPTYRNKPLVYFWPNSFIWFFRKLEKQKEKLCNTAKGRELPECWHPSTTHQPSIVPLVTTSTDIKSEITSFTSHIGKDTSKLYIMVYFILFNKFWRFGEFSNFIFYSLKTSRLFAKTTSKIHRRLQKTLPLHVPILRHL